LLPPSSPSTVERACVIGRHPRGCTNILTNTVLGQRRCHSPSFTVLYRGGGLAYLARRAVRGIHIAVLIDGALGAVLALVAARLLTPKPTSGSEDGTCTRSTRKQRPTQRGAAWPPTTNGLLELAARVDVPHTVPGQAHSPSWRSSTGTSIRLGTVRMLSVVAIVLPTHPPHCCSPSSSARRRTAAGSPCPRWQTATPVCTGRPKPRARCRVAATAAATPTTDASPSPSDDAVDGKQTRR
jgi:hypothetical protein